MEIDFEIFYVLPFLIALLLINAKRKVKPYLTFLHAILLFYLAAVIAVTLFPIPIESRQVFLEAGIKPENNFIPFNTVEEILKDGRSYVILRQLGGNLILLMPLGFLVPLLWKSKKSLWTWLKIGFLTSLGIETTQLLISTLIGFPYKIFDVDDLVLNTLGFIVGFGIFKVYEKKMKAR